MTNNEYGMDELMTIAQAIQDSHKNDEFNAQDNGVKDNQENALRYFFNNLNNEVSNQDEATSQQTSQKNVIDISNSNEGHKQKLDNNVFAVFDTSKLEEDELTPRQEDLVDDIDEALRNIANLTDDEVKQIYNQLKENFYADKEGKKYFKNSKKIVKKMIKSDKKRTQLRHLKKGKWLSVAALAYGIYLGIERGGVGLTYVVQQPTQTTAEYLSYMIGGNIETYMQLIPQADALIGAFALGCVLYASGKTLVKIDDLKTMRRLMIQAVGENMTYSELNAVRQSLKGKGESVKDAMITYPLKDFGKSVETLAREKYEKEEQDTKEQKNREDDGREL